MVPGSKSLVVIFTQLVAPVQLWLPSVQVVTLLYQVVWAGLGGVYEVAVAVPIKVSLFAVSVEEYQL